jgi:hypothetical protein
MLVVVLNDGETYTDVEGTRLVEVPDEMVHDKSWDGIDQYVKEAYYEGVEVMDIFNVYRAIEGSGA